MSDPAPSLLELRDLKVRRGGVEVVDVPSLRLHERELVCVIGPNGSGKSTLLLSMMGLLERAAGDVLYRGRAVGSGRAMIAYRRNLALVLQDPCLFDLTVYENVAAGLRIRGLGRAEVRRRVTSYLDRFRLGAMAERSARKLSGGEARRVSLARALVADPEVLLLDEPFTSLDPPTRQSIVDDLERTIRETGTAAILVTHEQSEALRLSDRIVVMSEGRIVQSDVPSVVMNQPVNAFVASWFRFEATAAHLVREGEGAAPELAQGARLVARQHPAAHGGSSSLDCTAAVPPHGRWDARHCDMSQSRLAHAREPSPAGPPAQRTALSVDWTGRLWRSRRST